MLKNVKNLYAAITNKTELIHLLASEFNLSANYIRVEWFSKNEIKEQYLPRIVEILQNTIKQQIENQKEILKNN